MDDILPIILVLLVVGAVIALLVWLIQWSRKRSERIQAGWREVADRLDGTYRPPSGSFWKRKGYRVEAEVAGVQVDLDYYVVSTGKSSTTYTRTRASTTTRHRLKVYKSHVFASLGKMLGLQDLVIGDPSYDDVFIIKSDDVDWAKSVLDEPLRREHLRQPQLTMTIDERQATTVQVGFDMDVERLTDRMRLTAALVLASQRA